MATTKSELKMTFGLDNDTSTTITLADAYTSLQASDVRPAMANIVANQAIVSGSAVTNSIKGAKLVQTTETTLI